MPKKTSLTVMGKTVREDSTTDYLCITDLANLKGDGRFHIANWLRSANTLAFVEEWERKYNPKFNAVDFDYIRNGVGTNTFKRSASDLIEAGCIGIFARRGRYGGTYTAVQWALHFANWLDATFYLETLDSYLDMHKRQFGELAARERFTRELAAKNHLLVENANVRALPAEADTTVHRRSMATEMNMINIAVFGLTAAQWRKHYKPEKSGDNMRNYASAEENQIISDLEVLNNTLIEQGHDKEARLEMLRNKATDLFLHYLSEEGLEELKWFREKRGW